MSTSIDEVHRYFAEQFDDVRQMVFVSTELRRLLRIEKKIAGGQLERHAGRAPDIARRSVVGAQQYLQTSVLSRLNVVGEMFVLSRKKKAKGD